VNPGFPEQQVVCPGDHALQVNLTKEGKTSMKKLIGMFAVAAALLFAGSGMSTPASAATSAPAAQTSVDKNTAANTDISAHRRHYRRYYAPRRAYYRPRYYAAPRYYAPRRSYGYGYGW
jgi:hypothetical protein